MNKLFTTLLLCLLTAISINAQGKSDKERAGLAGKVKSLVTGTVEFPLKDGRSVEGKHILRSSIAFNEEGNTTEQISYKDDGSILNKVIYAYDALGRNIGYVSEENTGNKPSVGSSRREIVLDDNGNQIEDTGYQTDGSIAYRFLYKYDAKGNKIEELFYSWNGSRTGKLVNTYDDKGNQLTQTSYNADDTISFKTIISYDTKGNKTEWIQYQGDILRYRVLFKYDDKGRVIEQETLEFNAPPNMVFTHAPVPGKVIYTYNDEKHTREAATYNVDGSLKEKIIYTLDEKGNEIGLERYNADGSSKDMEVAWYEKNKLLRKLGGKSLIKFEYDAQGNWTRKTYLIQSKDSDKPEATSAEYRIISYY